MFLKLFDPIMQVFRPLTLTAILTHDEETCRLALYRAKSAQISATASIEYNQAMLEMIKEYI